jgi:hypothetical protein
MGLRQINEALLAPLIQTAVLWEGAVALIDATDLPASCNGFKKKKPAATRLPEPLWEDAPSKAAKVAASSATRNTPSDCGGGRIHARCCWSP